METHPNRISAQGGKYVKRDETEFPDTQQVAFEYSGDGKPGSERMLIYEQRLWSTNYPHNCDSGAEYYGTKGQMFLSRRGKLEVTNDQNKPIKVNVELGEQNDVLHVKNFCDAIRSGAKLNTGALVGHLSTVVGTLGQHFHPRRSLTGLRSPDGASRRRPRGQCPGAPRVPRSLGDPTGRVVAKPIKRKSVWKI